MGQNIARITGIMVWAFFVSSLSGAEECGSITRIEGAGQVIRNGQPIAVAPDTKLQQGDLIRAPQGSSVEFSMNGVAGMRASDGAECEIARSDTNEMKVDLALGILTANLKKLPENSSFKVETPTAIASVRGTQFSSRVVLNASGKPDCSFAVRDSLIEVTAKESGETFSVGEGQAIDIPSEPKGNPEVRAASGGEIVSMESASQISACG